MEHFYSNLKKEHFFTNFKKMKENLKNTATE